MRPLFDEPALREDKPPYSSVPENILEKISGIVKSRVISGEIAYGGLSAAAGFILVLEDGRKIFAKGTYPGEMAHGAENLRQEIAAYQKIPILEAIAPRYIGLAAESDDNGWMLGLWEYVPADARLFSLEKMLKLVARWQGLEAKNSLTPMREKNYLSSFLDKEKKWRRIRDDLAVRKKFLSVFESVDAGAAWLDRNIEEICRVQAEASSSSFREGLVHGDLRPDNFLATEDKVYAIDWPNACRGPLVFDLVFLFSSIEAQGQSTIEDLFAAFPDRFSDAEISLMAALVAGFFADQIYREVPQKLPRLRWMQKGMFLALMNVLARRGYVESIPRMIGQTAIS